MMRRPPDKAGSSTVSERGVDSSNATLNTVFGGARQKSWMTTAGVPVRPTPRRASKSSLPTILTQETTTTVLPSPTPSAEPSPLLRQSDILQHSSGNRHPATDPVRVSNAIDLTPSLPASTLGPEPQGERRSPPSSLVTLPPQAPVNGRMPPLQTQGLPSPNISNVSYALTGAYQHSHRPIPPAIQSSIVITSTESPLQAQYQNTGQWPGSPNGSVQLTGAPNSGQAQFRGHEFRDQQPSPAKISSDSPNTMSIHSPYSPIVALEHGPSRPSAERIPFPSSLIQTHIPPHLSGETVVPSDVQRDMGTYSPITLPLKPKVSMIKSHISSVGGTQNLNNGLERPRFQLLIDACKTQDIFYVVLHQLFCAWDYDQSLIFNLGGLPTRDVMATAFSVLGQLIRHNEGMATNHLRWFANFPNPLNFLWETSEPFRQVVVNVGIFLYKLAAQWVPFSRQCSYRQYPPLVDELVNGLGILSSILQGVVFTATRRNLGLLDDQFGQLAEKIFTQDKKSYEELLATYNNMHIPPSAMHTHNQELANKYFALTAQVRVARQIADTPLSRPAMAANKLHTEFRNASVGPSSAMGQATRNLVAPGQGPRNNQWTQPMIATATGSSTPHSVAMGGRIPTTANRLPQARTATPSQEQQGMVPSHPILVRNSPQLEQEQNRPLHPSTLQDMTTLSARRPEEPVNHSRSPLARILRQHMLVMEQNTQQGLAAPQDQHQTAAVPRTQPRQLQFPSQMQNMMAHQRTPQHQATSVSRPPQLSRSSLQPTSQQQINRGGSPAGHFGGRNPEPQASAVHSLPRPPTSMKHQVQAYHNIQPPILRPLIPPLGYIHPADPPHPTLTALHQAHVRSPVLLPAPQPCGSNTPPGDVSRRFYQSVKGFALEPSKIPPTASTSKFVFTVDEQDLLLMAKNTRSTTSPVLSRQFSLGTLQYRLRCVRAKQGIITCSKAEWMAGDTVWPETVFIRVNDEVMEIRRKSHHLKDLPIDITSYILQAVPSHGSTNEIKISTPRSTKHNDQSIYFVAVEVIEILDHSQIMELCNQQRIPASQTLDTIKKSLAGPTNDDDDDISMVVSDLSIGLADPFTARIFDIPVRGDSCLHRECFDLEPFLLTRKAKGVNQPCMVDVWKCPLCGGDARPYTLRIDDFFISIRAKLANDENLDIRAIWISADGSWRPKSEVPLKRKASPGFHSDEEDEGLAAKQRILDGATTSRTVSTEARQGRASANQVMEVIELDDD